MPATTTASAAASDNGLILCHTGPSRSVPNLSSFVLKLETYLRMTGIPYKEEVSLKRSSKGKVPFIKLDGKEVGDTNFIIPLLNKKYEKDLNESLNSQEKVISLAFKRLIEENLYWTLVHYRWVENFSTFSKILPYTGFFKKTAMLLVRRNVKSNLNGHGMGRHTNEEVHEIAETDLKALSEYLGEKQFFMGENPSEIDASLFGLLAQLSYTDSGREKLIKEELKNLEEYTNRMRDRYFPDWEEKLLQEKKKEDVAEEKKADEETNKKEENGSDKKEENGTDKKEGNGSDKKEENGTQKGESSENGSKVEEDKEQKNGENGAGDGGKLVEEKKDEVQTAEK